VYPGVRRDGAPVRAGVDLFWPRAVTIDAGRLNLNGALGTREAEKDELFEELLRELARPPTGPFRKGGSEKELVGTCVGPFRIESPLGTGGMGAVYLAIDERLGRKVALKLLPRDVSTSSSRRTMLLREARSAAAVSHPNVAAIYEADEGDGRLYIAMEYVEGQTLRDVLAKGPLPAADAYRYAVQIARGMARAHRTGIVHRDLKPDNVMIDREGVVKILDFGLAKPFADARSSGPEQAPRAGEASPRRELDSTLSGWGSISFGSSSLGLSAAGTPGYMPPEQTRGAQADACADVFSFGVTVFEMLTGRRAKPDEALPRGTARRLARVVERCLRCAPSRRFADGVALESALVRAAPRQPAWTIAASVAASAFVVATAAVAYRAPSKGAPSVELRQMTFNSSEAPIAGAALSPDGEVLAYVEPRGAFLLDVATRTARPFATSPSIGNFWGSVAWFPDGARLLLGAEVAGRSDLWIVDVATGAASPMGLGDARAYFASVSPDGKRIAAAEFKAAWEGSIEVVDVATKERKVLYETHDEELVEAPRWSPDGERVAFVRGRMNRDYIVHDLDVVHVATGRRRTVMSGDQMAQESGDVAFDWSSDGRIDLAIPPSSSAPAGSSGLFAFDASEAALDRLNGSPPKLEPIPGFTGAKIEDVSFDAAAKRAAIVRVDAQADVFVGSIAEDPPRLVGVERVTLSDQDEYPSDWSNDSRDVLVSGADVTQGETAFALSLDSRTPRPIPGLVDRASWPVVGPAGEGILYFRLPPTSSADALLDLVYLPPGGAPRDVYRTPFEVHIPGRGRPAPRRWTVRCARATRACFLAHPAVDDERSTVLEALDVASGATTPRARFDGPWDHGFSLSSDAARLAVATPDRRAVDVLGIDGARLQRLETSDALLRAVAWSADDRAVFAIGTKGDAFRGILRLGLDGTSSVLWSTKEGPLSNLSLSPDGHKLAFRMSPSHTNVWIRTP